MKDLSSKTSSVITSSRIILKRIQTLKNTKILIVLAVLFAIPFTHKWIKRILQPVVVIVPHHNIVEEQRARVFDQVSQKRADTKKVILIAPDHFSPNQKDLFYSNTDWSLSNGGIQFDQDIEQQLTSHVINKPHYVKSDHGIYNILPDIYRSFPQAKVFPIIIGQEIEMDDLNQLATRITKICGHDCLLVASIDMSHYLPHQLANIHDIHTANIFQTMQTDKASKMEVDSPQSAYIAMSVAQNKKAFKWIGIFHTNSGEIEENRDAESTSHIMGWYQLGIKKKQINPPHTFALAVDIDEIQDSSSLGEGYFYGVDDQNNDLQALQKINNHLQIDKSIDGKTLFEYKDGKLRANLGLDALIFGVKNKDKYMLVLAPIEQKDGHSYLLRGNAKSIWLENNLSKLHHLGINVDVGQGTISNMIISNDTIVLNTFIDGANYEKH